MTKFAKCALGVLSAALLGSLASAQTPSNISVVSGNGQLVCGGCSNTNFRVFEPLTVLVTDQHGNPAPSAAVNWNVEASGIYGVSLSAAQTVTGSDGTTSVTLTTGFQSSRNTFIVFANLPNVSNTSGTAIFSLTAGAPETSTQYATASAPGGLPVSVSGTAGGTGTPAFDVVVSDYFAPVPNISIRLVPAAGSAPGASAACATGAGADPGSVLTDINGKATCTPILGSVTGTGTYSILIGGVANATLNASGGPIGYQTLNSVLLSVSPAVPGEISVISGDKQSGNPGQALANPLVAEVDTTVGVAVPGQTVTWSVTPAGAAQFSSTTTTSDANGRVSNKVTLASSASAAAPIQITATIAGTQFSVTFTVNVTVPVSGLVKMSGDSQTAPVGTQFANALMVEVSVPAGLSPAGIPISFTVSPSGSATLSATTVSTDSNGIASVTVAAGATAGPITVTALAGNSSVSFTLTSTPPGPQITSSSFVNGAGFYLTDASHSALTPCGIGTVIAPGVAPNIQGVVTSSMFGPLPYRLAQVSISFNNSQAALYNVANLGGKQQAAFQVPCDVTPSSNVPVTVTVGGVGATVQVAVRSAGPGIFQFPDSDGLQRAVIVRSDGSFASVNNPVKRGETVRVFITGMGPVQPPLATNSLPAPGVDSLATGSIVVAVNNFGERVVTARRSPELIGVDEIAFQVDPATAAGTVPLYIWIYPADNSGIEISNGTWISVQ